MISRNNSVLKYILFVFISSFPTQHHHHHYNTHWQTKIQKYEKKKKTNEITNQKTHLPMAMSWPKQRPIRLWWPPRNPPERMTVHVSVIRIRWSSLAALETMARPYDQRRPPSPIIAIANLSRCRRRCSKNYKIIHRHSTRPIYCHVVEAHLYHVQNQLQLMVYIMCCKRARIHPNPVSIWAHRVAIWAEVAQTQVSAEVI